MSELQKLGPLVLDGAPRATERKKRKNLFNTETIPKSSVGEYIEDGWVLDRELKTKTRVKKPKDVDENFENRFWLLLEQLGFEELNKGRQFRINFSRSNDVAGTKQIDVFAKDDETVVVVDVRRQGFCVRRQGFWHQRRPKLREHLAHLVGFIMRRVVCDASAAFRAFYV